MKEDKLEFVDVKDQDRWNKIDRENYILRENARVILEAKAVSISYLIECPGCKKKFNYSLTTKFTQKFNKIISMLYPRMVDPK